MSSLTDMDQILRDQIKSQIMNQMILVQWMIVLPLDIMLSFTRSSKLNEAWVLIFLRRNNSHCTMKNHVHVRLGNATILTKI